ncbi:hypothetical protein BADSM9389_10290 [Buttiauxella agrestis]|nr:hypothetical protein BADSM9389_10290 [Buttiauxella agrestis]
MSAVTMTAKNAAKTRAQVKVVGVRQQRHAVRAVVAHVAMINLAQGASGIVVTIVTIVVITHGARFHDRQEKKCLKQASKWVPMADLLLTLKSFAANVRKKHVFTVRTLVRLCS